MKSYTRRLIKFLLFVIVVFFLLLFLWPLLRKGVSLEETYQTVAGDHRMKMILLIIFAYCLIYPLINFARRERHISGNIADNRSTIEKAMEEMDYMKKGDDGSVLLYRRKSTFARIMMLGEDRVEIDITANPLIITGPRRDLKRIDTVLDSKLLREKY